MKSLSSLIRTSKILRNLYSPYKTKDLIVGIHGNIPELSLGAKAFFPPDLQSPQVLNLNEWNSGDTRLLQNLEPWFFQTIGAEVDRIAFVNLDYEEDVVLDNQFPFSSNDAIGPRIRHMVEEVVKELCSDEYIPHEILVDDMEGYLKEVVHGAVLGLYDYKKHSTEDYSAISITPIHDFHPEEFKEGLVFGECQNLVKFLGDSPSNIMTPQRFCDEIIREFENVDSRMNSGKGEEGEISSLQLPPNVRIEEYDEAWAEENGFNLFLGVSRGSETPAKILEGIYWGNESSQEIDLALVGKGITFDSGGYNLKPELSMRNMKGDMEGAAVVWSALKGLVELEVPINVVVITPLCENMIGGKAQKPGDVLEGRTGLTVELENTDAEGRLIMADTLTYAEEYNPKYLMDVSTLTGAISVALGDVSGVFSTSNELWEIFLESSLKSGELCWRMPMFSEYREKLDSDVADLRNLASDREGGSSVGAMFLNEFVSENRPYMHLDIAGSYYNKTDGMTGKTTSTLIEFGKILGQ